MYDNTAIECDVYKGFKRQGGMFIIALYLEEVEYETGIYNTSSIL